MGRGAEQGGASSSDPSATRRRCEAAIRHPDGRSDAGHQRRPFWSELPLRPRGASALFSDARGRALGGERARAILSRWMPVLRPKLRALEIVVIQDERHGRALTLRDTEGIAPSPVVIPAASAAVLARFDGRRSIDEIARDVARSTGQHVDAAHVSQLADELERAWMLDSPRFHARRRSVVQSFDAAPIRVAAHAGGAYHGDRRKLADFIERKCLQVARPQGGATRAAASQSAPTRMVGLCAPHMDLWRAAAGYGHAYAALEQALAGPGLDQVDTFVLLGTSHAAMRRPYAVCEKTFATPLGPLDPDREMIAELAAASRFDVREDQYLHKNEHSIEFQAVFVRHLLGGRAASIVPILCGLSECQARRRDPAQDDGAESFLRALRDALAKRPGRVLVIAGADLAHVGPRFGDPAPLDERQRTALRDRDLASIERATSIDAPGFFVDVARDLASRRVCGLGPIYTLLRALPPSSRGEMLHYEQCVDPEEGSIVSHTSLGFYG
ncbi:AmmeMemoRadiSam system protein B [Sorangium sp. So ce367]|uniref:AmmeMemoRadiSam system protein B n=1 Tax=Sorangium sp. So ce367 TaxID=3133305 RepID=UPI003F5F280E